LEGWINNMTTNEKKLLEIVKENQEVILALIANNRYNENLLKTTIGTYLKLNFDSKGDLQSISKGEGQLWNKKMGA